MILEISRCGIEFCEGCLTFPVNLRWFRVLAPCSAATKDCHLTHGITLDYRKTFMETNFLRLIHPEIILKEFNLTTCKETEKQSLKQKGWWLVTQERTHKIKAQFQCRHLRQGRWLRGLQYRWNYSRTTWSDSKYRSCHSTNSLIHNLFGVTNTIPQNQVTTCSDFPSDAMLWIREVEMVDSLDESKSSRSICGKDFPNLEMLDAKIASSLNKTIQNSHFKKKVSFEGASTKKRIGFHEEARSPSWSTTTFE